MVTTYYEFLNPGAWPGGFRLPGNPPLLTKGGWVATRCSANCIIANKQLACIRRVQAWLD